MHSAQKFILNKMVVKPEVDFIPIFKYGCQTGDGCKFRNWLMIIVYFGSFIPDSAR
jgi:hypothetical protein